jgi:transcriptional regulator with XRE-family HTH domain
MQNVRVEPQLRLLAKTADSAVLGRRIRETRLAAGLTQAEVADGVVSVAYLSRIETGERRPSPRILEHIADRLETEVATLLHQPRRTARATRAPQDHLQARNAARATAAWLRAPHDSAAYTGMLRAVANWEAQAEAAKRSRNG